MTPSNWKTEALAHSFVPIINYLRAPVLLPAEDQAWGDRVGRIVDPAGHVWNIAARIQDEEETNAEKVSQ